MSYIPEYHENYYRVEGTAFNQGKIGIGTINPVQLLHVSGGNIRVDGTGYVNGDLNVSGNLNVYGTSAQFAVSQIIAEDKSIELNVATGSPIGGGSYTPVAFSNDAGAENGGITLKSTQGDKEILYKIASPNSGWVSNLRWIVSGNYGKDTLNLSDTAANVGLTIATDTNLYRSGANQLSTDDNFASTNNGGKTTLQLTNTAADVGMTIGGDVNLYRSGANQLNFDDNLASTFNGGKTTLQLTNTTANVGMTIGGDTNLYRSGTDTLRTDDNLGVVLNLNVDGNTILGDTTSDTVTFNARANSNLEPSSNNAVNLGSSALNWGTAFINTLQVAANSTLTGDLSVQGNTTLGNATSDTVTFTARAASDLTPSTSNTRNLGSSTLNWGTGYLNTLSGSYITLTNSPVILNSGTTGEALLHLRANSTRPILAQSEFSGVTFAYQPSFIDKQSINYIYAKNGATTYDSFGFGSISDAGTLTARNINGTNFFSATKRIGYNVPTLGTVSSLGLRENTTLSWMRGGSGFGGFYFKARFGIGDIDASIAGKTRGFVGLANLIGSNMPSSQPSTRAIDLIGIGYDSGDNNWFFMHNSGATANATKVSLGSNYNCTTQSGNFIEFSMYAMPSSGVGFHVNIANSGITFQTGYYATTNLPALGTVMAPHAALWSPAIPTNTLEFCLNGLYIESYR